MNSSRRRGPFPGIFWIALIAGTVDIAENFIFNFFCPITPYIIFQYIASGLIGREAFSPGIASGALGVAIHYSIAFTWTAIYYAASRKVGILLRPPVLCGLLYGGLLYGGLVCLVMTVIVLPITRVSHSTKAITLAGRVNVIALCFFAWV